MHPSVQDKFHRIIRESRLRTGRALEVGGYTGSRSLLCAPELEGAERYCLNLVKVPAADDVTAVRGNANAMTVFEVLAPGGLLVIGAPGYRRDPEHDDGRSTATSRVHYKVDHYRFSEQAFRDVFFEGMEEVEVVAILRSPRIIGHGWKPGGERLCELAATAALHIRAHRRIARGLSRPD